MIEPSSAPRPEPLEGLLSSLESLADPTRLRLLRLLETHELGVAALCEILQLPQSTVSRHLKVLGDLGFVKSRAQGTNRLYRMVRLEKDAPARRLWLLARDQTDGWATARQDDLRLRARCSAARVPAAQVFFAGAAGRWDRCARKRTAGSLNQTALGALLPPTWTVADLGCGTGAPAAALRPHVARVIGVDQSAAMLKAARAADCGSRQRGAAPGQPHGAAPRRRVVRRRPAGAGPELRIRPRAGARARWRASCARAAGRWCSTCCATTARTSSAPVGQAVPGFDAGEPGEHEEAAGLEVRGSPPPPGSRAREPRDRRYCSPRAPNRNVPGRDRSHSIARRRTR